MAGEPLASDSRTATSSRFLSNVWRRSRRDTDDHCNTRRSINQSIYL